MGISVAMLGLVYLVRLVIAKLMHPEALLSGWATVVGFILLLGGLQLVCLGLLGQYVSRIFEESKKRPLYFYRTPDGGLQGRP